MSCCVTRTDGASPGGATPTWSEVLQAGRATPGGAVANPVILDGDALQLGSTVITTATSLFPRTSTPEAAETANVLSWAFDRTANTRWIKIAGTGTAGWIPEWTGGRVTTTDASVTPVTTYAMTDNTAVLVVAEVCAMESDGSDRASFVINALVYRDGGVATVQGAATISTAASAGAGTWVAQVNVDGGNSVIVRVAGQAATTINWTVQMKITETR